MTTFTTREEAAASLIADGFVENERGYFTKRSRTGGNLIEGPRDCVAICKIILHLVDPCWNEPDYYTISFI